MYVGPDTAYTITNAPHLSGHVDSLHFILQRDYSVLMTMRPEKVCCRRVDFDQRFELPRSPHCLDPHDVIL